MDQTDITASRKLRVIFGVMAAIMLALWGWSLIPPIENWDNPNEDGFSYVAVFYATITCLPVGLYLLAFFWGILRSQSTEQVLKVSTQSAH